MSMRPLVSAIIPTYNNAALVVEAVESALAQTYAPLEVIVVDDGSTDDTVERLACYGSRLRLIRQVNRGPAVARNAGIRAARGEVIAFLDSDDIWFPQKVERSIVPMLADPGIGVVYTDFCVHDLASGRRYQLPCYRRGGWMARDLFRECRGVSTSALMVRRACLERVGLFDEDLFRAQDWDLILRLAEQCRFHFVPEVLVERRLHGGSLSVRHADKYARYNLMVIEKARARRPDLYRQLYREALARAYCRFGLAHYQDFRVEAARREFLRSLQFRLNAPSLNYLVRSFLPPALIRRLRQWRLRTQFGQTG